MTNYISSRDAILHDLESAEAGLTGANQAYADAQRKLQDEHRSVTRAYEGRAANQRNVDRLKKALAIIDGKED